MTRSPHLFNDDQRICIFLSFSLAKSRKLDIAEFELSFCWHVTTASCCCLYRNIFLLFFVCVSMHMGTAPIPPWNWLCFSRTQKINCLSSYLKTQNTEVINLMWLWYYENGLTQLNDCAHSQTDTHTHIGYFWRDFSMFNGLILCINSKIAYSR